MIEIKRRTTGVVLKTIDSDSLAIANLRGADLQDADLRNTNLRGADLQQADLQNSYLQQAYLRGADLQQADLRGAGLQDADLRNTNLRGADLQRADLQDADLRGADLQQACLEGAVGYWQSHDAIASILMKACRDSIPRRKLAGLILISRDWCWTQFLALDDSEKDWAMQVLADAANPDDETVPDAIKRLMSTPKDNT